MNDKKTRWISFLAIPTMLFLAMEIFYVLSNVEYARIVWIPGFIFCFIILTGIYYLIFGIVGNSYVGTIIISILLYVLLIVNQIKIALSDEPVFLSDIFFLNSTGTFMGILKDYNDNTAIIVCENEDISVPVKEAVYIRLYFKM